MCKLTIIILFTILVSQIYSTELYFLERPSAISAREGATIVLKCRLSSSQGVEYHWELNGNKIEDTTRRYQNESDLVIKRLDRHRDAGEITCIARQDGKSLSTEPVELDIQWIGPSFVHLVEPNNSSLIKEESSVILKCQNEGSGEVQHEWFRNAEMLTKSTRYDIKRKRLHLKSVFYEDNGVYRCSSRNEAGVTTSESNFALAVKGPNDEIIEIIPQNTIVKLDSTAQFDCKYSHVNKIQWIFKETPVVIDERISILDNGSLIISKVFDRDAGIYKCIGGAFEYIAELKVAHITKLTYQNFEPEISETGVIPAADGQTFQVTCLPVPAYPLPVIWWMDPKGQTISETGKIRVDGNRLIIKGISQIHAGKYKCTAENLAGTTEKEIEIKIINQHNITNHPRNLTVEENKSAKLSCKHSGMKNQYEEHFTNVRWIKDGKRVRVESGRVAVNETEGTLYILHVLPQDRGNYICEITTAGFKSQLSSVGSLNVIEKLKFSPAPMNKNLELGSVGKVHCKASGTPSPTVQWMQEDTEELPEDVEVDANGTLTFKNVSEVHNGKYICKAFNSQGAINASVVITAVVSPRFTLIPANPTEVNEGSEVMLHCQAIGSPNPTVQWDKNLQMNDFDFDRFTIMENGTLLIKQVRSDDENRYGCTAGNSAGLKREEITLIVKDGGDSSTITRAVIITVGVAVAYIVLVVGLMVWCKCRRNRKETASKQENGEIELKQNGECSKGQGVTVTVNDEIQIEKTGNHIQKTPKKDDKSDGFDTANSNSSVNSKVSKKSSNYDKILLSRELLTDFLKLGSGQFGEISIAKLSPKSHEHSPSTETSEKQIVLVKSLINTRDDNCLTEFKRQLDMYHKIQSDQVVKLLGLCRDSEPHLMVLEYTDWGDLKQFLLATTNPNKKEKSPPPLQTAQILALCHQLAKGMEYISKSRLVHRDVACRNCVIDSKLSVKISHSASTEDLYKQEYFKHSNQIIPLRWMPYEAVFDDDFSTKSDCYSFACLVWEIFSRALLPFKELENEQVLKELREKTLKYDTTDNMADDIKNILGKCWSYSPNDRPSFSQLVSVFSACLKQEYTPKEEQKEKTEINEII